jgi:uncharacterized membrane protein
MSEQVERAADKNKDELGFERMVFFSDAIFSVAITLMALEIRLPELDPEHAADQIGSALAALIPHIEVYVLTFVVIGVYWLVHHRLFRAIQRFDLPLMWFNLIFLMMIALIPVATNALGTYPELGLTVAFYCITLALVGLTEFALWFYALRKHYFLDFVAPHGALYFALRILTPPVIFLLSLLLIPINTDWVKFSWVLMIPLLFILGRIFPRERAERVAYQQGTGS